MTNVFRIIIAGSRSATSEATYRLLEDKLFSILKHKRDTHTIQIVSGTANGADRLSERYAQSHDYQVNRFPADWNRYGKRAGYLRNEQMAENADALVALWDGQSRGTKHMIDIAEHLGLPTRVIRYDTRPTYKENPNGT